MNENNFNLKYTEQKDLNEPGKVRSIAHTTHFSVNYHFPSHVTTSSGITLLFAHLFTSGVNTNTEALRFALSQPQPCFGNTIYKPKPTNQQPTARATSTQTITHVC